MIIKKISTTRREYGGNIYEWYLEDYLAKYPSYQKLDLSFHLTGWARLIEFPFYLFKIWYQSNFGSWKVIRNSQAALTPTKKSKVITIIYHIDETLSPFASRVFQKIMEFIFFLFTRKSDPIVVISKYWKDFFIKKGFTNVHLAYCPFDLDKYIVSKENIEIFKNKFQLQNKPIVYIGNPQPKKGTHLVYEELKDQGYHLVYSGEGPLDLPLAHKLKLNFTDYITMLAACDLVITYSLFKEGWCRVAHESVLVGTPVIGSGLGGMSEILENTSQIICNDIKELKTLVKSTLQKNDLIPESALKWAKSFDVTRFQFEWSHIISKVFNVDLDNK